MVHVIIGRNNVNGELWAIVSNEKTTLQTFALIWLTLRYRRKFSYGINLGAGMFNAPCYGMFVPCLAYGLS